MTEVVNLKIKGKIWKTGNSHVLTIPKSYIESGMLNEGMEVMAEVEGVSA